jgi:hypothetical protein
MNFLEEIPKLIERYRLLPPDDGQPDLSWKTKLDLQAFYIVLMTDRTPMLRPKTRAGAIDIYERLERDIRKNLDLGITHDRTAMVNARLRDLSPDDMGTVLAYSPHLRHRLSSGAWSEDTCYSYVVNTINQVIDPVPSGR